MTEDSSIAELGRIRRVADQSCSAHARLADRYARRATALDILVLTASAWIVSLAFVDPALATWLIPFKLPSTLWIGLMSVAAFVATLLQSRLDLKALADAHRRAADAHAEVKKAAKDAEIAGGGMEMLAAVQAKLALVSGVGVKIPEGEFIRQKGIHLRKVALSRYLDDHPFASPWMIQLRWWWRDNVASNTVHPPKE
jgi:hypothetical protein